MNDQISRLPAILSGLNGVTAAKKTFLQGRYSLTYGELRSSVSKTRRLFAENGVGPGDRVVVASGDDAVVAILYAACLLSGAAAVVIDPNASVIEATVLSAKSRATLGFFDADLLKRAEQLSETDAMRVIGVKRPADEKTAFGLLRRRKATPDASSFPVILDKLAPYDDTPHIPGETVALILFTSGTTSQPKGVQLTHRNLVAQLQTFRRHYGYDEDSVVVNDLPLHHTDGLNQGPLLALFLGARLLRTGNTGLQSLPDMLDYLYKEKATHLITVPTVIAMLNRVGADYDDIFDTAHFRYIASTAGYLDERLWRETEERFNVPIVNSYGLTETVAEALYCGPTRETRKLGTIGKPVDCEARIVDENGEDVAEGDIGELLIRGDNVMLGYMDSPELTAEVMRGNWLCTGDLARMTDDGFFVIAGRRKNVIIRAGINIYPEDVNSVLTGFADIAAAATLGIEDELLGEKVVCCIVSSDPRKPPSPKSVIERCRESLSPEKIPNTLLIVEQLPLGPSGKVELGKLRAVVEDHFARAAGQTNSQDTPSAAVMAIAAGVFRTSTNHLSPESTEKDVDGWDSLTYLEFIMSLERRFDLRLAPRDVMNIRCLRDAMDILEERLA